MQGGAFIYVGTKGGYMAARGVGIYPPTPYPICEALTSGCPDCASCAFTRLLRIMYIMRECEYFTMRLKWLNHADV